MIAGCGGESAVVPAATPQVLEVGTEELNGSRGIGFRLEVRELRITADGWRVKARVTNATPVRWTIGRPHTRGGTKFGLFVASSARDLSAARLQATARTTPQLTADVFEPALPRVLGPGAGWAGAFSGRGRVPAGSFVSVAFGRFTTYAKPPAGFPARLLATTSVPIQLK